MLPDGWKKVHLKDVLDGQIKNGYSPNRADEETGFWALSLGALGDNGINATEVKPVIPTDKVLQSRLYNGDFLISRSNTPDKVGRSIRFKGEVDNCSYPDLMMRFKVNTNLVDADFIEHKIKGPAVRAYYKSCAAGSSSTMVKITKPIVEKTPLLLPPLTEQKIIAQILCVWDESINVAEQRLANSQLQKQSLMQQLMTGKKRFPEFSDKWKRLRVGDLLSVRKEKQIPDKDTPLFSLTIEDGITAKTKRYNREFLVKNTSDKQYKVVRPKDIVYNPANLRWGAVNYSRLLHAVVVSPIYETLYVTNEDINSLEFIAYSLMSGNQIRRFAAMVEGTLMERKSVKIEPFLATKIDVPPSIEEQEKIASVLSAAENEIDALKHNVNFLKEEKKALMQQLLTGKRRVKVD